MTIRTLTLCILVAAASILVVQAATDEPPVAENGAGSAETKTEGQPLVPKQDTEKSVAAGKLQSQQDLQKKQEEDIYRSIIATQPTR